MSATVSSANAWVPYGLVSPIPAALGLPLAANAQVGHGQIATYNASGYAALNDGSVPGQVAAGVGFVNRVSSTSPIDGNAVADLWQGVGVQQPGSTLASDIFLASDVCVPAWIADENTLGKLSHTATKNRSLGGLVLGVLKDGTPRAWVGMIAHTIARALLVVNAKTLASFQIADAAANTATAERTIPQEHLHGVITSVTFTGAAVVADNTDYDTITISKRDGAGGAAVSLATYDSRAANQGAVTAFTPMAFALTATAADLNILETDIITLTVAKAGAGKALTGSISVNGKVI